MAPILGIPRMSSAFYRMRKFLECVEHMHDIELHFTKKKKGHKQEIKKISIEIKRM